MSIDPETHRLVRHGVTAMLNPADRLVLERALRLREEYSGTLTALSMGAPQAADVLLSAWMVGADRGYQKTNDGHVSTVVGMGRGIQDMDGLDLCCDFADAIGADIGATNAVVRMQLLSQQYQIGTNGRTIRPDIYIACGISGSLQHLTGVRDAGCIVAINTDPKAEIFKYANYGIVGDLFQIIPELERQMKEIL